MDKMNKKQSRKVLEMIESEEFGSLNDNEKVSALVSTLGLSVGEPQENNIYSFDALK